MSIRGDILGWVIQRLSEIDAADEGERHALFADLRAEIRANGYDGAEASAALPHLESAIARQEMHWLREAGGGRRQAETPPPPKADKPTGGTAWQWPRSLVLPGLPPGPEPGEATGPFSDHIYKSVKIEIPGGTAELNIGWSHDPACNLTANSPVIGFSFQTRAATFPHAVDHLSNVLKAGGLTLPTAIWKFDH